MYIKEIKRKNGSTSFRIVESVRKGNKVGEKIIRHLGTAKEEHAIEALRAASQISIIKMKNEERPVLPIFKPEEFYGINPHKNEITDDVHLKNVKEEKRINEGIGEIFGKVYDQLNFLEIIEGTRKNDQWNQILKSCVLARIADPASKRKTAKDMALDYALDIPLEKIYRMMDHISKIEDDIKAKIARQTITLLKQSVDILFFDVTTLYFESFTPDDLRDHGFSKDCKFKETQVVLALITTTDGMPISYELFPGNTNEGKTLIQVILKLKQVYDVKNILLVADRAMFSEENLVAMEQSGINYIVAAKLRALSKEIKQQLLTDEFTPCVVSNEFSWIKEYDHKGRRLIVSYSSKRAAKDANDRSRLVERIFKKVKNGKIRIKDLVTNHGSKKYVKVIKDDAKINQDKIVEDAMWDGLHGVITNSTNQHACEILEKYRGLWQIEAAFRMNKNDLKMRPVFHWKEDRIRAHVSICFLAYSVIKHTSHILKEKNLNISFQELKEELLRVEASIVRDKIGGKLYAIPSKVTSRVKDIYQCFNLKRSGTPYAL